MFCKKRSALSAFPTCENLARGARPRGSLHLATTTTASTQNMTELELSASMFGSKIVFATDEFFGPACNILQQSAPVCDADRFTDCGRWVDAWHTRRRRDEGHDWCIVRLGAPGLVTRIVIDLSHLEGDCAAAFSVQGTFLADYPRINGRNDDPECVTPGVLGEQATPAEMLSVQKLASDNWPTIVPLSQLHTASPSNSVFEFKLQSHKHLSHLRLNLFPDGAIARFRVFGYPVGPRTVERGETVDLGAICHGAQVLCASDCVPGSKPENVLHPTKPKHSGDGWTTPRSTGKHPDRTSAAQNEEYLVIKLACAGLVHQVVLDTSRCIGNEPASCALEWCQDPHLTPATVQTANWKQLLPRTKLSLDHSRHVFDVMFGTLVEWGVEATHVRLLVYPDGGINRVRLHGLPREQALLLSKSLPKF